MRLGFRIVKRVGRMADGAAWGGINEDTHVVFDIVTKNCRSINSSATGRRAVSLNGGYCACVFVPAPLARTSWAGGKAARIRSTRRGANRTRPILLTGIILLAGPCG